MGLQHILFSYVFLTFVDWMAVTIRALSLSLSRAHLEELNDVGFRQVAV